MYSKAMQRDVKLRIKGISNDFKGNTNNFEVMDLNFRDILRMLSDKFNVDDPNEFIDSMYNNYSSYTALYKCILRLCDHFTGKDKELDYQFDPFNPSTNTMYQSENTIDEDDQTEQTEEVWE